MYLDQSELTEKLDQVEHLCKEWKALFKKWPDVTKEQRNRIREIQMIVPNLIPSSQDFEALTVVLRSIRTHRKIRSS